MCPFPSNMNDHVTLQTKGTSIYLTVKESYMQFPRRKINLSKLTTPSQIAKYNGAKKYQKQKERPPYQVHSRIYHNGEHHWDLQGQLLHVDLRVYCTYEPIIQVCSIFIKISASNSVFLFETNMKNSRTVGQFF